MLSSKSKHSIHDISVEPSDNGGFIVSYSTEEHAPSKGGLHQGGWKTHKETYDDEGKAMDRIVTGKQ